ncbi:hypothetical protein ACSTHQ_00770 [Vibrio parahaemolyticus]
MSKRIKVEAQPYHIYRATCPLGGCGQTLELPHDYTESKLEPFDLECPSCGQEISIFVNEFKIENL